MGVFDFWKKPLFIYNFDFNYFIVYWSFDTIRIMLLWISSSIIAEWLWYRTFNPETWVRFPEGMTSFYFTWNKNYTDTRSARGKMPFLFFSMILYVFLSRPFQGKNLKKIYGTRKWQKTMGNFRREFREHRNISVDRLWSTQENKENHWKE